MKEKDIQKNILVFDVDGLLSQHNCANEALKIYLPERNKFEGESLLKMTERVNPHVLIGCSGQKGIFTKEIL